MSTPTLSVIVVNWNTRDLLERSLQSVEGQRADVPLELIVVDNGSSDESPAMVARAFPRVHLIQNSNNRGFAAANNQGIGAASGRYLLLLNSDAEVEPSCLRTLIAYGDAHPQAGVLGPRLINPDGSLQPSGGYAPTTWWTVAELFNLSPLLGRPRYGTRRDYSTPAQVEEVSGAAMCIRRAVVEQIGGLDEGFSWGYEDVDYCLRARRAGFEIHYVPDARVRHVWGGSRRLLPAATTLRAISGRQRYFEKHFGTGQARVVMAATVSSHLLRLGAFGVAAAVAPRARPRAQVEWQILRGLSTQQR